MSIPEAPFDGEAHARKEGAWVAAYAKTTLNEFVDLVRSYMAGCKKYYEDTLALIATAVEDVDPDETEPQCRLNGEWVPAPAGGGGGEALNYRVINTYTGNVEYLSVNDDIVLVLPEPDYPNQGALLMLPEPTENMSLTIILPSTWGVSSKMTLFADIRVKSRTNTVYTGNGSGDTGRFLVRGEFRGYFIDGSWYFVDTLNPEDEPEQPS